MPGYIKKVLQRYKHPHPSKPRHAPHPAPPWKYGKAAQEPLPKDDSPRVSDDERTRVQQVVGAILFYARAINSTALMALSILATQ